MSAIQIITGAILVLWMGVTTMFYLAANVFGKEDRRAAGYQLYLKYTPQWWKRITRLVVLPAFIAYVAILFYQKFNKG
jgi:hypothetical protein